MKAVRKKNWNRYNLISLLLVTVVLLGAYYARFVLWRNISMLRSPIAGILIYDQQLLGMDIDTVSKLLGPHDKHDGQYMIVRINPDDNYGLNPAVDELPADLIIWFDKSGHITSVKHMWSQYSPQHRLAFDRDEWGNSTLTDRSAMAASIVDVWSSSDSELPFSTAKEAIQLFPESSYIDHYHYLISETLYDSLLVEIGPDNRVAHIKRSCLD